MKQGRALQRKEQRKSEERWEREHEERQAVSGSLDGPGDALCFHRIVLPGPPVREVPSALRRTCPQRVPYRLGLNRRARRVQVSFAVGAHQTGDPVRLIPCMGVLEADEEKFLFKLFRYSSANNCF